MTNFFAALALFLLAHTLPEPTGVRSRLINRFGRKTYIIGYSIFSTLVLIWLIIAALDAPYISLWQPGPVTSLFPIIAMIIASILFTGAVLHPNPLSLSFVHKPILSGDGLIRLIRHPLLWSLFLWAASHTIANGDLVSVIMFGGFALFSLAGMQIMQRRARKVLSADEYAAAMALTSGPLLARIKQTFSFTMVVEIVAGLLLYALVLNLHELVIGVDPTALLLP